ncbi:3-isopropylmalate dehydratase [Alphaproteobacteria bacterium]|jgi:3-isopropylmalate/(R)-2-methylmalate dehydratase small subunit|nr:3-isopropylmalate dehydratase [Alphaproteobacteria bacterium]
MALANLHGRVAWIFDEIDFDVDQIVGVKNIKIKDPDELARLSMAAYEADFASKVAPGDLLIGNINFGYGHPHYPPMIAMRKLGISGVIAESFSPGYWRGEIAMGFPQIPCPGILGKVHRWDELIVNWSKDMIINVTQNTEIPFEPLPEGDTLMLESGGIIGYLHQRNKMETGNG